MSTRCPTRIRPSNDKNKRPDAGAVWGPLRVLESVMAESPQSTKNDVWPLADDPRRDERWAPLQCGPAQDVCRKKGLFWRRVAAPASECGPRHPASATAGAPAR